MWQSLVTAARVALLALGHSDSAAREQGGTHRCPQCCQDCPQVGAWQCQLAAPCWGRVINAHPASLEVSLIKYDLVARAQCPVGGTDVEGMMLGLRHCALEGQERLCVCVCLY